MYASFCIAYRPLPATITFPPFGVASNAAPVPSLTVEAEVPAGVTAVDEAAGSEPAGAARNE